ncbi:MAG: nucleoside hydrolase [Mycobacteriales bacterium]
MSRPILIDCDPGHDDAIAILFALGSPQVRLTAITTVAGNQTLDKTTHNARWVCTVAGVSDVPVAAGCDRPLVRPLMVAADIHGETGLDGPAPITPTVPLDDRHAVDLIIEQVMRRPGELTLVPTGPLTNIAVAMRREPRIVDAVREVVLMGGAYTRGNRTPAAEFNIAFDPEAAAAVFDADWQVTMVGLDPTHQARATTEVIDRIRALRTPVSRFVEAILTSYGDAYRVTHGLDAPPVHDPCAVAHVVDPDLITTQDAYVVVETQGRHTAGMTVTDFRGVLGQPLRTKVATHIDADAFWDRLVEALDRLGADRCPRDT